MVSIQFRWLAWSVRRAPCLIVVTWLGLNSALAAVVIDPAMTGATDVGYYGFPPIPLANPLPDPFVVGAPAQVLVVGNTASGTLGVSAGGQVNWKQVWQGLEVGSFGSITVDGLGSTLTSSIEIRVGLSGAGELKVVNGGTVSGQQIYAGSGNAGVTSHLTIDGINSKVSLGSGLYFGTRGHSVFSTLNGGAFEAANVDIGSYDGMLSEALVTGSGSKWTVAGDLNVGAYSRGSLTISNGGEVTAGGNVFVYQADPLGPLPLNLSSGTLRAETLYIGAGYIAGTGNVFTKGLVADLPLNFDATHDLMQEVPIAGQPGVVLQLDHSEPSMLGAGYLGNGTLAISAGKQVHSADGILGYYNGSSGQASVSGAGSKWMIDGDLAVGKSGQGELTIGTGATVEVGGSVVFDEGAAAIESRLILNGGELRVGILSASPSQLLGHGTIHAGGINIDGELKFDEPGDVSGSFVLDDFPGQNVTVDFGTSELTLLGAGYRADGTLIIRNGARAHSTNGALGKQSGSHGRATVEGAGSEWTIDDTLQIGAEFDSSVRGTLRIVDGGVVASQTARINEGSQVEVGGAGSRWDLDHLSFGQISHDGLPLLNIHSGGRVSTRNVESFNSNGALRRVTIEGTGSQFEISQQLSMSGALIRVADGGTLAVGESQTSGPGLISLQGSILHLDGGVVDLRGGQFQRGNGEFLFDNGVLRNFAWFGGDLWQTAGRVELEGEHAQITGHYLIDDDATLALYVTGPSVGASAVVNVNRSVFLDGTLEFGFIDTDDPPSIFVPMLGASFKLLHANGAIIGSFSDYVLPTLKTGHRWAVRQTAQELALQVVAGDYNGNGVVDAADYTLWRDHWGQQVTAGEGADGNRNGVVDQGDYEIWNTYFGAVLVGAIGAGAHDVNFAVPEPCGLLLCVGAFATGIRRCRRRDRR